MITYIIGFIVVFVMMTIAKLANDYSANKKEIFKLTFFNIFGFSLLSWVFSFFAFLIMIVSLVCHNNKIK